MDLRLEVIGIPVSDVDTAKAFYTEQVGFRLDHDVRPTQGMRVVQMTPPGSPCSVVIGEGMPLGEPGSIKGPQLVVDDIDTARSTLAARGVQITPIQRSAPRVPPAHASPSSPIPMATAGQCRSSNRTAESSQPRGGSEKMQARGKAISLRPQHVPSRPPSRLRWPPCGVLPRRHPALARTAVAAMGDDPRGKVDTELDCRVIWSTLGDPSIRSASPCPSPTSCSRTTRSTPRLRRARSRFRPPSTSPSSPAWTPGSTSTALLGLEEGDAHVIRNAGGVVTDDEIRSLAISQRLLGTKEIVLIHHTDCGMLTFTDDEFKAGDPGGDRDQAGLGGRGLHRPRRGRPPVHRPDQGQPLHPEHGPGPRLRLRRGDRPLARSADRLRVAGQRRVTFGDRLAGRDPWSAGTALGRLHGLWGQRVDNLVRDR